MVDLSEIQISKCATHHIRHGKALYDQIFLQVLKFHQPGLAPVLDQTGAYHISLDGKAAYPFRYQITYGYYNCIASIVDVTGCCHIDIKGKPLYKERYLWCGNFQENICVVKSKEGYFHLNRHGRPIYAEKYDYVGDYKDGVAVAVKKGNYIHINLHGQPLNQQTYLFLDVFHKGYARAQDERGWFHVDITGNPAYSHRYKYVEPFYNDFSLAQTFDNAFVRIGYDGEILETIVNRQKNHIGELSGKMVGFWQTYIINAAVKLKVLKCLPASTEIIANQRNLSIEHTHRLMRALWEIGIVNRIKNTWQLTELGKELIEKETGFMASASIMWLDLSLQWKSLIPLLKEKKSIHHTCFKDEAAIEKLIIYQKALEGYAKHDFLDSCELLPVKGQDKMLIAGSCARAIIPALLKLHPKLRLTYYDSSTRLRDFTIWEPFQSQVDIMSFDLHEPWPHRYNTIVFPRYLHYWPDQDILMILANAANALHKGGSIIVFEMLLEETKPSGGMLDLNMLVETGGRLRTLSQWIDLMKKNMLLLRQSVEITSYLTFLEFLRE